MSDMSIEMMKIADVALNLLIFVITGVIVVRFFRKEGKWAPERGRFAFRFFTTQSNVLCACGALLTAAFLLSGDVPRWAWTLKYVGTAAVTVTMLTVLFFLWPVIGKEGPKVLLTGSDLFLHLINPLLAIASFCFFEKRGMSFLWSLWGMVPVLVYGQHYLYRIVCAPEGKRWDDYYRFNQQGKWPLAFFLMVLGTFLICMGFLAAQNA